MSFFVGTLAVWLLAGAEPSGRREANVSAPSLPLFRDKRDAEPLPEPVKFPPRKDPAEIKRLIDAYRVSFPVDELWHYLSISPQIKVLSDPSIRRDEVAEFNSCPSCIAELKHMNLDSDQESEAMLSISSHGGYGDFRLLVFDKLAGEWQLAGYTDHDINKYYSPAIRVTRFGKEKFLVLTCQGGWGTGLRISFERWYRLENRELRELFSFPNESFTSQTTSDLVQESRAKVATFSDKNGSEHFSVEFINRFSGYSECSSKNRKYGWGDVSLFTTKKRAVYSRSESGSFELNSDLSEISEEEIYQAHTPWGLTPNKFRKFYSKEIGTIQRTPSSCRAIWLNKWLARPDEFGE